MTQKIWDITVAFRPDLPLWPGDPPPKTSLMKSMAGGYRCNVTRLDSRRGPARHKDNQ